VPYDDNWKVATVVAHQQFYAAPAAALGIRQQQTAPDERCASEEQGQGGAAPLFGR
jgi:hypothetical protein